MIIEFEYQERPCPSCGVLYEHTPTCARWIANVWGYYLRASSPGFRRCMVNELIHLGLVP